MTTTGTNEIIWRPSEWITLKDAAGLLSGKEGRGVFSPRQLHRAANRGDLRAVRVNYRGDWRTTREWLDAYVLGLQARPFTRQRKNSKHGKHVTADARTEPDFKRPAANDDREE